MYTIDTNAFIYYLHGEEGVKKFLDDSLRTARPLYISAITITELLRFPNLTLDEENFILDIVPAFSTIPVDAHIAKGAGRIGRIYNLKVADSIIAATALFTGSAVVTRNVRDFKRVVGLRVESI
ncbi:MAG: type II toxin-antitoxin system VapC family toxin [bacterium]|nr:type II toxin-antitoxin system VapC family toxin [bacterium]